MCQCAIVVNVKYNHYLFSFINILNIYTLYYFLIIIKSNKKKKKKIITPKRYYLSQSFQFDAILYIQSICDLYRQTKSDMGVKMYHHHLLIAP